MVQREKISKKMMVMLVIPLMVPSLSLIGFAISDFGGENVTIMILIAIGLFVLNLGIFFAVYRALNNTQTSS